MNNQMHVAELEQLAATHIDSLERENAVLKARVAELEAVIAKQHRSRMRHMLTICYCEACYPCRDIDAVLAKGKGTP